MALGWPEKISSHEKSSYSGYLKKKMARKMRRLAKKDPGNAPLKGKHRGWS